MEHKISLLQKKTINQILDLIKNQDPNFYILPSEAILAEKFNISRTTIRNGIRFLIQKGILKKVGKEKQILRSGLPGDYFEVANQNTNTNDQIEAYFIEQIKNGNIRPGVHFTVLQLSNDSGLNRTIVRDFLNSFSRFGLIQRRIRKNWQMVTIDNNFIDELISARQKIEKESLESLIKASDNSSILDRLEETRGQILSENLAGIESVDKVLKFETSYFRILIQTLNNRFIADFYDKLLFTCNIIDYYCLADVYESAQTSQALIQSLSSSLLNKNINGMLILKDHYIIKTEAYKNAIQMLDFP